MVVPMVSLTVQLKAVSTVARMVLSLDGSTAVRSVVQMAVMWVQRMENCLVGHLAENLAHLMDTLRVETKVDE